MLYTLYQCQGYHESAWAKMYPREIFERIDGFLQGRRYEDIEIIPRLYLNAKAVIFIDATVYYYRPNPDSFINTWSDSRADAVFAAQSVLNYVTEHFDDAVPCCPKPFIQCRLQYFRTCLPTWQNCIGRQLLAADYTTAQLNCPR